MKGNNLSDIPETIPTAFAEICRTAPHRIAMQMKVEDHYTHVTFAEVNQQVQGLARALRQEGIRQGTRVALLSENRPEWVISYLSIIAAGGTAVPLDIQLTKTDLQSLLAQSKSQVVVASHQTLDLVKPLPSQTRVLTLDSRIGTEELVYEELVRRELIGQANPAPVNPTDTASLLFTSGTTGRPKGVVLSHHNLLSNAQAMINSGLGSQEDNFLLLLPLHHAYPFMIGCLVPLLMGAKITILQSLKGPDLVQCIRDTRITMLIGVPQIFSMIRRAVLDQISRKPPFIRKLVHGLLVVSGILRRKTGLNLGRLIFKKIHQGLGGSLRLLCSGGAKLEPDVARDFESLGFTILQGYGLTETSPVVTFTPLGKPKLPSVGLPLPGVTVRIATPNEEGIGELVVKGPNVMEGYDDNPEATSEVIRDGWFYTGDLGYLDREGYLFLTGRSKELIVTPSGKNIYPEELEKAYQASPAIQEICVLSANLISKEREGIHAIILPDFDFLKTQKLLDVPQHLKYELNRIGLTLAPYKRISGISLVKEPLPRTRLGKVKRHQVLSLLETEPEHEPDSPVTSEMEQESLASDTGRRVLNTLTFLFPQNKPIRLDDHLDLDLGLDSLRRVELIASLEQQFCRLPDSVATEVITVKDLVDKIDESLSQPTKETAPGAQSWSSLIATPPPHDLITQQLRPPTNGQRLVESIIRVGLWMISRFAFRLKVAGLHHLPQEGPFMLASNHLSHVDPFMILISIPSEMFARIFSLGWEPHFRSWPGRFFAWIGHVIPIGPETSLVTTLQISAECLRQKKGLLVFPEGERSVDGRPLEFRKGIGILACELNIPVVPIWIDGTYEVLPAGARCPRIHPVELEFGEALTITQDHIDDWKANGQDPYEAATRLIQERVGQLRNAHTPNP